MSKLSVGVIFGGASSEYEISLRSAASVIGQMKEELYDKVLIGITKDGRWFHYTGPVEAILENRWEQPQWTRSAAILPDSSIGGLAIIGTSEVIPLDAGVPGAARPERGGRHHPGPVGNGPDPLCGLRGAFQRRLHG